MNDLLEALFVGQEIQFRSKWYMGLLTKRKTEWHIGYVRKIHTDNEEKIWLHLFYDDPIGRRVFCRVPLNEVMEKHPVFEIRWKLDDGTKRAESVELLELIKIGDSFQEVWNNYLDNEAQKYHYEINRHLALEKACSTIAPSTNLTRRSLNLILSDSWVWIKKVLSRLLVSKN